MATSLDIYPNSYDLMAIEPIQKILESYLCNIEWMFNFQKASLKEKKQIIEDICLEIDQRIRY